VLALLLDPLPELPAPLDPPKLDDPLASVPVDPAYGFDALDVPLDVPPPAAAFELPVPVDDPPLQAIAMIDPVARAAIEVTLRFMIWSLLRKEGPMRHGIMPRRTAPSSA
jgi:hypothetical protein